MPRVKLTLEYDGSRYVGWQFQLNGPSICERLNVALERLLGEPVDLKVAGRTDAGVHAEGQVVCFDTARVLPKKAYERGLNDLLPPDIAVVLAEEVDPAFDPRHWSEGKRYCYRISNRPRRSPLRRLTHWELFSPLDLDAMREAAKCLVGRHDFSAFRAADCQAKHASRELRVVRLEGDPLDAVSITVEGTAFLKHMVRNIVGTLVEVGRKRKPASWVAEVLAGKDRNLAGPTAPPHGLVLATVFYGAGRPERLGPARDEEEE